VCPSRSVLPGARLTTRLKIRELICDQMNTSLLNHAVLIGPSRESAITRITRIIAPIQTRVAVGHRTQSTQAGRCEALLASAEQYHSYCPPIRCSFNLHQSSRAAAPRTASTLRLLAPFFLPATKQVVTSRAPRCTFGQTSLRLVTRQAVCRWVGLLISSRPALHHRNSARQSSFLACSSIFICVVCPSTAGRARDIFCDSSRPPS